MRFGCVTPCKDAQKYIEHTMLSVINQTVFKSSTNNLHYIIKDGGSKDETVHIAKTIANKYSSASNVTIEIVSNPDDGIYDALAVSFQGLMDCDIYSYINAGDFYSNYAFEIVSEIFSRNDVHFLTGLRCVYNDKNHLIRCQLPFTYSKKLMLSGCYGTVLPHVQQESTFWGKDLHRYIDFDSLRVTTLAGDYLLWKTFINYSPLFIVSAHLSGFRIHEGQLSEILSTAYKDELTRLADCRTTFTLLLCLINKFCWYLPDAIKKSLSNQILDYDHEHKEYGN